MHTHFRTNYHQGIAHVVTGIAHVCHLDTFQVSELLTNCHNISQYLCRMELIGQTVPDRYTGILRQIIHDGLVKTTVLNTIINTSKYTCCIGNAFLLANL